MVYLGLVLSAAGGALFVIGAMGALTGPNGQPWGIPVLRAGVVLFGVGLAMLVALLMHHFCR